jgi:Fe-S-cluster containining protein
MWKRNECLNILEWVNPIDVGNGKYIYDIWFNPDTGEEVERCPWLRKLPRQDKYICRIHDVKPKMCRQYPKSKRHAKETSCRGFDPSKGP